MGRRNLTYIECFECNSNHRSDRLRSHLQQLHGHFLQFISVKFGDLSLQEAIDKVIQLTLHNRALLNTLSLEFQQENVDKLLFLSHKLKSEIIKTKVEDTTDYQTSEEESYKTNPNANPMHLAFEVHTANNERYLICPKNVKATNIGDLKSLLNSEYERDSEQVLEGTTPSKEESAMPSIHIHEDTIVHQGPMSPQSVEDMEPVKVLSIKVENDENSMSLDCETAHVDSSAAYVSSQSFNMRALSSAPCSACTTVKTLMNSVIRILEQIISSRCKCANVCCCMEMILSYFTGPAKFEEKRRSVEDNFFTREIDGKLHYYCVLCFEAKEQFGGSLMKTCFTESYCQISKARRQEAMKRHLMTRSHTSNLLKRYLDQLRKMSMNARVSEWGKCDTFDSIFGPTVAGERKADNSDTFAEDHIDCERDEAALSDKDEPYDSYMDGKPKEIIIAEAKHLLALAKDRENNEQQSSYPSFLSQCNEVALKQENIWEEYPRCLSESQQKPIEIDMNTIEVIEEIVETEVNKEECLPSEAVHAERSPKGHTDMSADSSSDQANCTVKKKKVPKPSLYACKLCTETFWFKCDLINHHKDVHYGKKRLQCARCSMEFATEYLLRVHEVVHFPMRQYKCQLCPKIYSHPIQLRRHQSIHTDSFQRRRRRLLESEPSFECSFCHKKFKAKGSLKTHVAIHTGEKLFECGVCNQRFTHYVQLRRHSTLHMEISPHHCTKCNRNFRDKHTLDKHLMAHEGARPHICTICNKGFTSALILRNHMNRHLGRTPYPCPFCPRKFSDSSYLIKHKKIHLQS